MLVNPTFVMADIIVMMAVTKIIVVREVGFQIPPDNCKFIVVIMFNIYFRSILSFTSIIMSYNIASFC